jgi:protein gp37
VSDATNIDYLDATWNPVTGCSPVSAGCAHCWAKGMAHRMWGTRPFSDVQCHEDRLTIPLHWRKPRRIGVSFMGDLFHEAVPDAFLDRVFAVMALASQHTFMVLSKRPERMREYFSQWQRSDRPTPLAGDGEKQGSGWRWPLPNVWLGVSVEDQPTADARIPLLLQTRAAVRYASAEPLLGPIDFRQTGPLAGWLGSAAYLLDLVIVGGENGPRPCDVAWIRSIVQQCGAAGTACYVKQLGANVRDRNNAGFVGDKPGGWPMDTQYEAPGGQAWQGDPVRVCLKARKGNDPAEWPADLRVRELPEVTQ